MADLKFRLNLEAEDIEIVVNDKVVDTIGQDVVASWVAALNEKNAPVEDNTTDSKDAEDSKEETSEEAVDTDEGE